MGDEVEIRDDAVVVGQDHHLHAAESGQFQEDLPFLLSGAVDNCVLDCKQVAKLVIEEAKTLLLALESQLEAVCVLLDE